MNKKERVRAALRGDPTDHTPVALWGHDFLREWSARDLAEQTLESYRRFDWDFIKLNPRWTFFGEAWGNTYEPPREQRFPRLTRRVVERVEDMDRLAPVDPSGGVFGEQLEALSLVLSGAPDVDVIYTLFSPLATLGLLCGGVGEPLVSFSKQDPARVHRALTMITGTLTAHAKAALAAGAPGIFFAPLQWTSRQSCDDDYYREFGRPYDLAVVGAVREAELNILHVCGNQNRLPMLLDYPVRALNWADHGDGNLSTTEVRALTDLPIIGGIDHAALDRIDAEAAAAHAREALAVAPGRFILGGGCGISPRTPDAVKSAIVATAHGPGATG